MAMPLQFRTANLFRSFNILRRLVERRVQFNFLDQPMDGKTVALVHGTLLIVFAAAFTRFRAGKTTVG